MLEAETANESVYAGTMNLTHSLLRSRITWLTTAFTQSDIAHTTDTAHHRELGTAEIQIGPHIFVGTSFFSIDCPENAVSAKANAASDKPQQHLKKNDTLVFEFAENKGVWFNLPLDFDIVKIDSTKTSMQACFYANPLLLQAPSEGGRDFNASMATKPNRSTPPTTEQILSRVNISLNKITNPELVAELLCYFNDPLNTVWRDYRRVLSNDRPIVKYAQSFFPPKYRQQVQTALPCPRKPSPAAVTSRPRKTTPAAEPRQSQCGGKVGYTAAVAAAKLEYYTYTKENSESSADEHDANVDPRSKPESISGRSTPMSSSPAMSPPLPPPTRPSVRRRARKSCKGRLPTSSPNAQGRVCKYCECAETPIWRRGPSGAGTLCNACGVKWKLGKILQ